MMKYKNKETLNNDMISDNNLNFPLQEKYCTMQYCPGTHKRGVVSHHMRQNHKMMMSSGVVVSC